MTTADILRAQLTDKPGVVGATIVLRSGRYFDFLDPRPEMVQPDDISWALAYTCRFGGQSLEFYSVAQHCCLVASILPPGQQLKGLLHDAAEAYVGDMVGPLKQLCPDYKAIESRVEAAVAERFRVELPWGPEVKHADLRLLRTEQRDLTAGHGDNWNGLDAYTPLPSRITPWSPPLAAANWMSAFNELAALQARR